MIFKFIHLNKTYTIKIEKSGDDYKAIIDNTTYELADFEQQQNIILFKLNDKIYNIYFAKDKGRIYLTVDGDYFVLASGRDTTFKDRASALQKGDNVSSPMPGLLVKITVAVDETVKAGTILAIVEAMKMQNELRSPRDGVVKKINYKEGEQVDALQPIVELKT